MIRNFKKIDKDAAPENVLLFLEKYLAKFDFQEYGILKDDNEGLINKGIENYLDNCLRRGVYRFKITSEEPNRINRSKVDFAILEIYTKKPNPFFTIEAKRLPAYKTTFEKDYVYNEKHNGGIERFKHNKHGIDKNGIPLKINAMIGYIEKNDFRFWHTEINNWINEKISTDNLWRNDSTLINVYMKKIAKLHSLHKRINNENVELHHFWLVKN